ncbi:MAG: peptidoglycan recognition family protein, partial [Leptolyngbyaceae bacterium]|nr:peptidoglycan recognition family protein [Leptolyngbyaceae bacterium]
MRWVKDSITFKTWKFVVLAALVGAIALGQQWLGAVNAEEPQHPRPATLMTEIAPNSFGTPIPGVAMLANQEQADSAQPDSAQRLVSTSSVASAYTPREEIVPADPTNYGPRYLTDIYGNPATYPLIIVLHETVGSASSAINLFRTPHPRDADQVSYHSLIRRDGTIVHLVHPQMRAFGAGNSVFEGPNGPETVQTNPDFPPSVNNFAFHISLESPGDGRGNQRGHSGYTTAQYQSLAWLVARLPVPDERITTHQAVDRSGSRRDPR